MNSRMYAATIGSLISAALLLSACSGSSDDGSSPSSGSPAGGAVDRNATLTYADSACEDSFDPGEAHGIPREGPLLLAYDTLIQLTPDLKMEPGLAKSWKWINPTTFQLSLQTGVTFHDGEAFNAAAVVANFQRMATYKNAGALVQETASYIKSSKAVDANTVQITLKDPESAFPSELTGPGGMMIAPNALNRTDLAQHDYGSGPYTLSSFTPGSKYVFTRYAKYRDPAAAAAKTIDFLCVQDSTTRLNGVRSGEINIAPLDPNQVSVAKSSNVAVTTAPSESIFAIFMNNSVRGLSDPRVRQAFMYGIDRASIVKSLEFGLGQSTTQFLPPNSADFDSQFGDSYYAYDPAKAKQLVQAAGFGGGLTLELSVVNRPEDQNIAQSVQQMLKQVGITLKLKIIDSSQTADYVNGKTDMLLGRWGGRADALQTLNAQYNAGYNPGKGSTPAILAAISKAQQTLDPATRDPLLKQISGLGAQAALSAPLFAITVPYATHGCIVGFTPSVFGANILRGVGVAKECTH
jgi:peptide/nickel transport system substrate-binding protein